LSAGHVEDEHVGIGENIFQPSKTFFNNKKKLVEGSKAF